MVLRARADAADEGHARDCGCDPTSALIEVRVRLYNRTPFLETFLWWANIACTSTTIPGRSSHRTCVMSPTMPGGRSRRSPSRAAVTTAWTTAPGSEPDADLRWYRNIPVPTSYMATGTQADAFGGYDHAADAGFVHVADHTISPGKKLWTWGDSGFGHAWDRNLTDADGPYVELMAGVYTDNQPDFSQLAPHETRTFSQSLYPIARIGPPDAASVDAAVSLRLDAGTARIGVAVSRPVAGARIELLAGDAVIVETVTDLAPDRPSCWSSASAQTSRPDRCWLRVSEGGRILVSHRPRADDAAGAAPEPAREPPPPERVSTVEQLYLIGAHLERYRHATRAPEPYWPRLSGATPSDIRCNLAIGLWHLRRGEGEPAVRHPSEPSPHRHDSTPTRATASVCMPWVWRNGFVGNLHDAYEAFGKAAWDRTWQPAALLAMAEIESTRGDVPAALALLDKALLADAGVGLGPGPPHRPAATQRPSRRGTDREPRRARARPPATPGPPTSSDCWTTAPHVRPGPTAAGSSLPSAGTALDVAHDYARAGLLEEAIAVLAGPFAPGRDPGTLPMVQYTLGWLHERAGDTAAATRARASRPEPAGRTSSSRPGSMTSRCSGARWPPTRRTLAPLTIWATCCTTADATRKPWPRGGRPRDWTPRSRPRIATWVSPSTTDQASPGGHWHATNVRCEPIPATHGCCSSTTSCESGSARHLPNGWPRSWLAATSWPPATT